MKATLLLAAFAISSLLIGMFAVPLEGIEDLLPFLGYPFTALSVMAFLFAWLRAYPSVLKVSLYRKAWEQQKVGWLIVLLASFWILSAEPWSHKIFQDELYLHASSYLMHLDRLAAMPRASNYYEGFFQLGDAMVDKRPLLFPFLLSLVHDITGYRFSNPFYLNAALTIGLNALLYFKIAGGKWREGLLVLGLVATLPIWISNATSGHLEILNLFLLVLTWVLFSGYTNEKTSPRLSAFLFSLLLLLLTRYENALYLIAFGGVLIVQSVKNKEWPLSAWVAIIPALLIPNLLQYRLASKAKFLYWQDGPFPGRESTFSLSYVADNFKSAIEYLFAIGGDTSNSLLLTLVGLVAFILILRNWVQHKQIGSAPNLALGIGISLSFLLVLIFNYGLFDLFITARLSLPLQLGLILLSLSAFRLSASKLLWGSLIASVLWACSYFILAETSHGLTVMITLPLVLLGLVIGLNHWRNSKPAIQNLMVLSVLAWSLFVTRGITGHHEYLDQSDPKIWNDAKMDFLDTIEGSRSLILSRHSLLPLTRGFASASLNNANKHPELLSVHLDSQNYDKILAFQIFVLDPQSGEFVCTAEDTLPLGVESETIWERMILPHLIFRVVQIIKVSNPSTSD